MTYNVFGGTLSLNQSIIWQCEHSALHPSGVAKSSTSFGWGKGGNVTSAGWQVTLCDPIWYVSSRSGVGGPACKLLYAYFTFLLLTQIRAVERVIFQPR